MTSRSDVEAFRRATLTLSERAQADVARIFARFDPVRQKDELRAALLEVMPEIVAGYGEASAAVAADFYEGLREDAKVKGSFATPLAVAAPAAQVLASTRWATSGLYVPADELRPAAVLGNLHKATDRLVKLPGRQTLAGALTNDPSRPRFARIPTGRTTCRFCATLASRGAVYVTKETAGGLTDFHDHCDCSVTAIFDGQALPAGYDPKFYEEVYKAEGGSKLDLTRGNKTSRAADVATAPTARPSLTKKTPTSVPAAPSAPRVPLGPPAPAGYESFPRHLAADILDEADEVNPFYGTNPAYGVNCQMTTTATELRMRGLDVEAMPNFKDGRVPYMSNAEIPRRWRRPDGSLASWDATPRSKKQLDAIVESWPEGARGFVSVVWKDGRSGHIFNVQKRDGRAFYIDAQPASRYTSSVAPSFANNVSWQRRKSPGAHVMRVDELTPDVSISGQVRARGTHEATDRARRLETRDARRKAQKVYEPEVKRLLAERNKWIEFGGLTRLERQERRENIFRLSEEIAELRGKIAAAT